jgi:putative transcriptional regulator
LRAILISRRPLDVRAVREGLGLSQEQFARRYNLELDAVQNWEQGRRTPDRTVQSYLRVIAAYPEIAARAQEER